MLSMDVSMLYPSFPGCVSEATLRHAREDDALRPTRSDSPRLWHRVLQLRLLQPTRPASRHRRLRQPRGQGRYLRPPHAQQSHEHRRLQHIPLRVVAGRPLPPHSDALPASARRQRHQDLALHRSARPHTAHRRAIPDFLETYPCRRRGPVPSYYSPKPRSLLERPPARRGREADTNETCGSVPAPRCARARGVRRV